MSTEVIAEQMEHDEGDNVGSGQMVTSGFGQRSVQRTAETASLALAEQAKAAVQARYVMAMERPRNLASARTRLLNDCKRPAFAEAAIYRKPVGEGVEGPSIRMAEAAARALTNVYAEVAAIYDDADKRIVRVSATDLEANVTYPMDVTIAKTIERNRPMPGRKVIATRKNSRGGDVYIIAATDEEILDKERAVASKALRTCLLRLVPGDILEEAIEQCYRTRDEAIRGNLKESREKMVGAFRGLGVSEQQLSDYLGHALSDVKVEEIAQLRALFTAIKDKETTWAEAAEHKRAAMAAETAEAQPKDLAADLAKKASEISPKGATSGSLAKDSN